MIMNGPEQLDLCHHHGDNNGTGNSNSEIQVECNFMLNWYFVIPLNRYLWLTFILLEDLIYVFWSTLDMGDIINKWCLQVEDG